jgi:hypothetical protein
MSTPAIKDTINARALAMGGTSSQVSALTIAGRAQIAELIRAENEDAEFAVLNTRYVIAIEKANALTEANTAALLAYDVTMRELLAAIAAKAA